MTAADDAPPGAPAGPVEGDQGEDDHPEAPPVAHPLRRAGLTLFAMCGMAIAQPLLGLLGDGPTFFVAEGSGRLHIVLFTVALVVLPAAVMLAVVAVARWIRPVAGDVVLAVLVGVLAAATLGPPVSNALDLGARASAVVWMLVAVAAGLAFARLDAIRTFTRILAFAPILFAVSFLFFTPVSDVLFPASAAAAGTAGNDHSNVVVMVFDETSMAAMLGADGQIDAERFPNLARLRDTSTLYTDTATVTPWTHLSVPALLSGTMPDFDAAPVAGTYPRNLFSMLAPSRDLVVSETVTSLCPDGACDTGSGPAFDLPRFTQDLGVIYLHNRLPQAAADRWLPDIDNSWADFGDDGSEAVDEDDWQEAAKERGKADQDVRYEEFLDSVRRPDVPTAWFLHLLDPHLPMRHLADGRLIEGRTRPLDLDGDWVRWGSEQAVVDQSRVRYLVQLQDVDRRVGEVMDRLESEGMADDTMLVITSDHGIAFEADDHRRAVPPNAVNENQVVPVPLFVRYPGQTVGAIDDRPASVLDIVPTVADALDIDLGSDWAVDGESLLGPEQGVPRVFRWGKGDDVMDVAQQLDPESAAAAYADLVGPPGGPHDLYAWGPWRDLVGRPVTDVPDEDAEPLSATITAPVGTPTYDPSSGVVPALIEGKLATTPPEGWVAVSVNGIIAGVGPVAVADGSRFSVLVDPALLRPGANDVDVWLVGADGRLRSVTSA